MDIDMDLNNKYIIRLFSNVTFETNNLKNLVKLDDVRFKFAPS